MSGESSSASPGGSEVVATSWSVPAAPAPPLIRASPGRTRSPSNAGTSSGLQASTGARVVGRSTPAGLMIEPTRLLTSVDLPAPVEPADDDQRRRVEPAQPRQDVVVDLRDQVVADSPCLVGAGNVELEPHRAEVFPEPLQRPDRIRGHGCLRTRSAADGSVRAGR